MGCNDKNVKKNTNYTNEIENFKQNSMHCHLSVKSSLTTFWKCQD